MKKILLTTTAMVAFAGAASAEVSLSGYAEMGIIGGSAAGFETQFHNDIDVKFTLSGETDNGLTFGATIDLDEVTNVGDDNGIPNTGNDSSVFISGGFGTITMGDTDGAFDWAMQEVGDNVANAIADDHTAHAGFNGNSADGAYDGQVLRYDNTFGDFGVAISAEMDDTGVGSTSWGLGVKYNASLGGVDLGLGLAYHDYDVDSAWGLSVDAKFGNGFRAILNYSDLGDTDGGGVGETHTGIGLGYTSGAVSVEANYGIYDEGTNEQSGIGLAVNYDLGGGAVVMAGYGDSDCNLGGSGPVYGCADESTWSIGLGLSF